ncbi:hypothetical protein K8P03_11080 [Anaerococcus murdochii]|uniref:Uncharacterized protein n=1 Tax=Anaerococcus murdochii TaxID=411577 RepID=A0ABS7T214_9FIRM|nr:hypothetical protein [Anaerococcus murdochii]MBZ2385781.1 hypothetical protein [Anaerococcus murdochii]MBZ2387815.1 hypothetical protein [Anaerococcus murdochii]
MNKTDSRNGIKLLQEILKLSMHELMDDVWEADEEDLMERFEMVLATPDDEYRPTSFSLMQITGLIGAVLIAKHRIDEKELMKMLKDSNALFVKEIISE